MHKKKFMKQRYAEPAASAPKAFFALCTSGKLHHSDSPTALKLQAEEFYSNSEINAKELKNDKRSRLLTPVE